MCAKLLVQLLPARLLCPRDSPGKNTEVGCHSILQGIFLTQGLIMSLMLSALAGGFFNTSATWKAPEDYVTVAIFHLPKLDYLNELSIYMLMQYRQAAK